jgi:hypothetical protein
MKNLFKSTIVLFLLVFVLFTAACEKQEGIVNEDLNESEVVMTRWGDPTYVIENAKLVLIEKRVLDQYRNVVDVYVNAGDTTEGVVDIIEKSANCPKATGTFKDVTVQGVRNVSCTGTALDCWVGPYGSIANAIYRCR